MATKTGVVRAGRSVELGTKKGDDVVRTIHGPGKEVTLDEQEYSRLFKAGVIAAPNSQEAQAARVAADTLPSGFPGLDALRKSGIETFSALKKLDDLEDIEGIGPRTASAIAEALKG